MFERKNSLQNYSRKSRNMELNFSHSLPKTLNNKVNKSTTLGLSEYPHLPSLRTIENKVR